MVFAALDQSAPLRAQLPICPMLVSCSSCTAKFNIPDAKIAGKRARMKCKKCGTVIAIDGTGIKLAASAATSTPTFVAPTTKAAAIKPAAVLHAPSRADPSRADPSRADHSRAEPSRPEPSRPANEPPRSSPFSALSPRWRVAEPSGRQHELSLGELVDQYRARTFEAGTLVCRPGHDEWIPPYDYPEIVQAASPGNESREPFPTFSEDTVALGAAESAALTRQALALESTAPIRHQDSDSFFDDSDVDIAMSSFDGLTTVGPAPRNKSSPPRSAADISSTSITSRPPAPASERAMRSSVPLAGGRPRSSTPPPRSSLTPAPPSASQRSAASPPEALFQFPSSAPPPPSLRPSLPPGSQSLPRPPSLPPPPSPPSGPPIPAAPRPPSFATPPAPAPPPEPSWVPDSEPPPPMPSSPGLNHELLTNPYSTPPKRRSRTSLFVLLLVLLAGAVGGVYLFRPALFERGLDQVRERLGLKAEVQARAPQGPPFDEATAGVVLTRLAAQASRCKEPQGPIGKGRAQVLYAATGKPTSVAVSKPFHETTVGRCVIDLFQSGEVPPFGGMPVIVNKTFEVHE